VTLVDERCGEGTVGDLVDLSGGLLGVPSHLHFAVGVAGAEQAAQLGVTGVVETFMGFGQ
jgi:hypothetical protein